MSDTETTRQTVHVVYGGNFGEDEPAVFEREQDAHAYAQLVGGMGTDLIICDRKVAAQMIDQERRAEAEDEGQFVPYGIAWPIKADGCDPPDGWSWVEKGDDEDVYDSDEDAAKALIEAGIGTEYRYFHRATLEDRTKGPGAEWADLNGCSVAINVPEPEPPEPTTSGHGWLVCAPGDPNETQVAAMIALAANDHYTASEYNPVTGAVLLIIWRENGREDHYIVNRDGSIRDLKPTERSNP